jgi:putative ABC transport system permease protein
MLERYLQILSVSLEAVFLNKSRSVLTALGIIFGVAAVIAMMAIGNGARQEILEQIKMVGVNNIVIMPSAKAPADGKGNENKNEDQNGQKSMQKKYVPGLTTKDVENIRKTVPTILRISPEIEYHLMASSKGKKMQARLNGVSPAFFRIFNLKIKNGTFFTDRQTTRGEPVCVIGPEVAAKLFPDENPLGKHLKAGNVWLQVIGIIRGLQVNKKAEGMGISDYNLSIFTPLKTVLLRYKDRALINQASLMGGGGMIMVTMGSISFFGNNDKQAGPDNNQLDKVVVQVKESSELVPTAAVIKKILSRRHQNTQNFEIKIPELLLKQEQKTKDIFNIVLGAIAGISLLVGGIGIMNIMLASVMERIREIGVRRATGATQNDIIFQFLAESTFISISGGFIGVLLGVIMARVITLTTGILTIVSFWSILLSFGVAAAVGIIFGYLPAKKAALKDPVESLRHD